MTSSWSHGRQLLVLCPAMVEGRISQCVIIGEHSDIGDDCIVEAGCYITAGTLITLPDGNIVKAKELSGHNGLLTSNSFSG